MLQTLRRPAEVLSADEQRTLLVEVLRLNLSLSEEPAFVVNWQARIGSFLTDLAVLELAWQGGQLVGHYGHRQVPIAGGHITYVDNFTVAPGLQARGLGKRMTQRFVVRTVLAGWGGRTLVASRTSNPHVAAMMWQAFAHPAIMYPSLDPRHPSSRALAEVARKVAAALWPDKELIAETGVLVGAYGGSFIPCRPSRHPHIARFFDEHICAARGDAIVQIVELSLASAFPLARYFATRRLRRWWHKRSGAEASASAAPHSG
ncbi:MAG: hypothetical protein MJE77_35130 [Proteobacteria bacterium]|nr:hypothetical protein [Pseudomonadota bacterium]